MLEKFWMEMTNKELERKSFMIAFRVMTGVFKFLMMEVA
jgi:hypothetical protein